jgi:hypothetical protein
MLVSIDEALIDNRSPIYLSIRTDRVLEKNRWRLGELDVKQARNSIPHYFNDNLIHSIFPEPYLKLSLPLYLISCTHLPNQTKLPFYSYRAAGTTLEP